MPKIFAHRGGAGYFVENSLRAFEFALESGCDGAECDVHLTRDGDVIVHHNPHLNHRYTRKTDGSWIRKNDELRFEQMSVPEINKYTIGEPNPQTHDPKTWPKIQALAHQRIPTLRQVIETIKRKSTGFELVIEIKSDIFSAEDDYGKLLVDRVMQIIYEENFTPQTILCSFDWRTLLYARSRISSIPIWFTTHPISWLHSDAVPPEDIPPAPNYLRRLRNALSDNKVPWYAGLKVDIPHDFPQVIKKAGGDAWFCYHTDASATNIKNAHLNGLELTAWSVNLRNSAALKRLENVDAVCVDYPLDWL